mmetsp:Transcript_25554/g.26646  ORF Transcript_25554/g.26646 Transcript_25554/m.26646 type:complete len:171 (+) Transcript_25554:38-550(+)
MNMKTFAKIILLAALVNAFISKEYTTPSIRSNIELAKNFIASLEACDITRIRDLTTKDFEWVFPTSPEFIPYSGTHNLDTLLNYYSNPKSNNQRYIINDTFSQNDKVSMEATYYATNLATGEDFSNRYNFMFLIRDGKVAQYTEFFDTASAMNTYFPGSIVVDSQDNTNK